MSGCLSQAHTSRYRAEDPPTLSLSNETQGLYCETQASTDQKGLSS